MRPYCLSIAVVLSACATMKNPYPDAQAVVDRVADRHPDLVRLTLHAVPKGSMECTQVASTMAKRRGKASDPEDLKAMNTGEKVVLEEKGALDVTVPILMKNGKPTAIAGVTLKSGADSDRAALIKQAEKIAGELASEISAAGKALW